MRHFILYVNVYKWVRTLQWFIGVWSITLACMIFAILENIDAALFVMLIATIVDRTLEFYLWVNRNIEKFL